MTQPMRDRVMNKFRKSGLEFLVATGRGGARIDVENVQVVFNYDLPYDAKIICIASGAGGGRAVSGKRSPLWLGASCFRFSRLSATPR